MINSEDPPLVVAFVADLMFTSKIQNVVSGLGYDVRWVGSAQDISALAPDPGEAPGERLQGQQGELFEKITAWQPALLLFDLTNEAIPWARWIPTLKVFTGDTSHSDYRLRVACEGGDDEGRERGGRRPGAGAVALHSRYAAACWRRLMRGFRTIRQLGRVRRAVVRVGIKRDCRSSTRGLLPQS